MNYPLKIILLTLVIAVCVSRQVANESEIYSKAQNYIVYGDPSVLNGLPTFVYFYQPPNGDYIANALQGNLYYSNDTCKFRIQQQSNGYYFSINLNNYEKWLYLTFVPPQNHTLRNNTYFKRAQRYPFQQANTSGIDVSGNGAGCNTICGEFYVAKNVIRNGNLKFIIQFIQHCECDPYNNFVQGLLYFDGSLNSTTLETQQDKDIIIESV